MLYYRCKCGVSQAWSSMGVASCNGCGTCHTTLETSPDMHRTPDPHEPVTRYDEQTGKPYQVCLRCLKRLDGEAAP